MANRLLRNIAVSIGASLAAGRSRTLGSRQIRRPAPNLSPILTRLESIESRVTRVELTPSPIATPAPEEIEALGTLLSSQSEDIAALRQDIQRIEQRNAEQVEAFGQKVALMEQLVPQHIEASISAKMTELEQKLRGEFSDIHHRTVDAFADTIEKRVIGRINLIENSLIEQSHSIVSLREKSLKTDDNLQRLLEAVEKLCVRAEAQAQLPLLQAAIEGDKGESKPEPTTPSPTQMQPSQMPPPMEHLADNPQEAFAAQYQRAQAREPEPQREPDLAMARAYSDPSARRGFKPVGMAILGLAILGFRLIR